MRSIDGVFSTGKSGLGIKCVNGCILDPKPAARIMACIKMSGRFLRSAF